MKKKLWLFVIFVLLFQVISMPFSYVEAWDKEQPKVCNWPSEMMSHYFTFQLKMKKVLQWSELNSERFSAEFEPGWLFTNRVLDLHTTSAIELLSSSVVANLRSFVSNSITSMFLLELAAFSVVQSNVEWFAILFADWPIVRDYKKMLDIETELFDLAYFRSMEIDLTQEIDEKSAQDIKKIIKEYQDVWLLTWNDVSINWSVGDIILDLVQMNAVMKQFIMVGGKNIGGNWLKGYNWCFWKSGVGECNSSVAIIRFDSGAVAQLLDDYKGVRWPFWWCNSYGNHIKWAMDKIIKNNSDSVSQAMQDVKDSIDRLGEALLKKNRWNFRDPCKDLSEYEMAQLQAYWWGNRTCGQWINLFTTKSYISDKFAHSQQKNKRSNGMKKSKSTKQTSNLNEEIKKSWNSSERAQKFKSIVGTWVLCNDYYIELWDSFLWVFNMTMNEYSQAQENGVSTDFNLFSEVRWLLDQVDASNDRAGELRKILNQLQGKQCSE